MVRRMQFFALILTVSLASLWCTPDPSRAAEDENMDNLVRMMEKSDRTPLAARVVKHLFTLKLPADQWERLLSVEDKTSRQQVRILADSLIELAKKLDMGDLVDTDYKGGYDGKSPLLGTMVDSWQGRLACTIEMPPGLDTRGSDQAWRNVMLVCAPLTNTYYNKPRSGKFLLSLAVDAKAPKLRFNLSKDGTQFRMVLPAYADISQSTVEEYLKLGQ